MREYRYNSNLARSKSPQSSNSSEMNEYRHLKREKYVVLKEYHLQQELRMEKVKVSSNRHLKVNLKRPVRT